PHGHVMPVCPSLRFLRPWAQAGMASTPRPAVTAFPNVRRCIFIAHSFVIRLELSRPVAAPPFDDDLLLRVELECVAALAVQVSEEASPGSAEREEGHRGGDAHVDSNVTDFG